eukprot:scaffold54354_cov49-Cyclotella_meneghiniana.AAC.8
MFSLAALNTPKASSLLHSKYNCINSRLGIFRSSNTASSTEIHVFASVKIDAALDDEMATDVRRWCRPTVLYISSMFDIDENDNIADAAPSNETGSNGNNIPHNGYK